MTCERCRELLTDYHFHELPAGRMKEVREHLDQCPACRVELERLAVLTSEVGSALGVEPFSEEEVRDTVRKAGAFPDQRRGFHPWIWVPAAAVLLMGFLVVSVVRYGERSKAMEHTPTADLRQEAKGDFSTPTPSGAEERNKQESGRAFEENLPLQADGKGSASDKRNELQDRIAPHSPAPSELSRPGAKDQAPERKKRQGRPVAVEPALRDAEVEQAGPHKPPPPPRSAMLPLQRERQQLSAASGVEEAKSQPGAAPPQMNAPDKDEAAAGEERPRPASKEKALEESDVFHAQGKLSGVGGSVAVASSYETTKDCLKKGLLPPPESIRVEDFTQRFPPPYSEDARWLARTFAMHLKGGEKTTRADDEVFLGYLESKKSMLKKDAEIIELIWMIETAARIKSEASPAAGTGRDGFVPEPQP